MPETTSIPGHLGIARTPPTRSPIGNAPPSTSTATGGSGSSAGGGSGSGSGGSSGGSGGSSGGSSGSGGGGGQGSPGNAPGFAFPKLARPTWYAGLWPPNNAASTIRNGWFALLGDLSQYPYNANLFFAAYATVVFASQNYLMPAVPTPIAVSVNIYDASGNLLGIFTGSADSPTIPIDIVGSFSLLQSYTLAVFYTLPGSTPLYQENFGPFLGSQLAGQQTPPGLQVLLDDYPAQVGGKVTVLNTDGTAATGVFVVVSLNPANNPTVGGIGTSPIAGLTDSSGVFAFSAGSSNQGDQEYTVTVEVFAAQGAPLEAIETWTVSWSSLVAGTFAETIMIGTLPSGGDTGSSHHTPPPHHGREP
jgi:hypothetical protein